MKKKKGNSIRSAPIEDLGIDLLAGHDQVQINPDPLFHPPCHILEKIPVSKVGHTFGKMPPVLFPYEETQYLVQDFLVDQTGFSGCDGKMSDVKTFDLTTATTYAVYIYAKTRRRRITVVPPPSVGAIFIGLDLGRRYINAASDVYFGSNPVTGFGGLSGSSPVFSYNRFAIGTNTNHWIKFTIQGELTSPIHFKSFQSFGAYPARSFDPGPKEYTPFCNTLPYNLPGPNTVPFMMFAYRTSNPVDPGPFVFIH